jgi:hypothetical protein
MRPVSIKIHHVRATKQAFPFPAQDVQLLYRTAGIDLRIDAGDDIAVDPTLSGLLNYPALVRRYRDTDRAVGHLVVGQQPMTREPFVAGQLLDLTTRGVAAVYTRSNYLLSDTGPGFLQTCIHEIGHMLNLSHEDGAHDYDSAMNQIGARLMEPSLCWKGADTEASIVAASGQAAYFEPPARPLRCYPLAFKARSRLNTLSDGTLLPWGGVFEGAEGDHLNDR